MIPQKKEQKPKKVYVPSAGVGKKLMRASKIKRIPHAGCHNSGWYALKLKQTFVFVSNLPDGVKNIICGGFKGYSGGNFTKQKINYKIRWTEQ